MNRSRAVFCVVLLFAVVTLPGAPASQAVATSPEVTSISPANGPIHGGTEVTIAGSGFEGVTSVAFGDSAAATFRVDGPDRITAVSPPHGRGVAPVVVGRSGVRSAPSPEAEFVFTVADGSWAAGSLPGNVRLDHTLTALPDGRALAVGGVNNGGDVSAATQIWDPPSLLWSDAPDLPTARSAHSATLLGDGTVLVAGGYGGPGATGQEGALPLSSATLFNPGATDPATGRPGRWLDVAPMPTPRANHIAVLLDGPGCHGQLVTPLYCGGVLVAGGDFAGSAAIFSPGAGAWVSTGPMSSERGGDTERFTASVLPDGRVLVAGGVDTASIEPSPLSSSEIYDPEANTWSLTGPMNQARFDHSATSLADGKVMVLGGGSRVGADSALATTEIFDPDAIDPGTQRRGRWVPSASLLHARTLTTAVTLTGPACGPICGTVLVVGGTVADGDVTTVRVATTELYDPALGHWIAGPPVGSARYRHRALVLSDGTALVDGGTAGSPPPTGGQATAVGSTEAFTPRSAPPPLGVAKLQPPSAPAGQEAAATITGTGLFPATAVTIGGRPARVLWNSSNRLDVVVPPNVQGAFDLVVTTSHATSGPHPFHYGGGRWRSAGQTCPGGSPTPTCPGRYFHTATTLDGPACRGPSPPSWCGQVLVTGGGNSIQSQNEWSGASNRASAVLYDPDTGGWTPTGSMSEARKQHTATLLDGPECHLASPPGYCGTVLVAGGSFGERPHSSDEALSSAETFSPESVDPTTGRQGRWEKTGPMGAARYVHSATLLDGPSCRQDVVPAFCGEVLVTGGTDHPGGRPGLVTTEIYDPGARTWTTVPGGDLGAGRGNHTATLLGDGRVLVAGGLALDDTSCTECGVILKSAEIFDPAERRWRATGAMALPRFAHTATLLASEPCAERCGEVLVAGGTSAIHPVPVFPVAAERYDPASGEWRPAGIMADPAGRSGHTATPLAGGRVLVAGSGNTIDEPGAQPSVTAETYDPVADQWEMAAPMAGPRGLHTATPLGGPACAGSAPPAYCGDILMTGGTDGSGDPFHPEPLNDAEVMAPAPVVQALTPARGPSNGGHQIVVSGSGLQDAQAVSFGGLPAASYRLESPGQLTAVAPPHPSGAVQVTVLGRGGPSATKAPRSQATFLYEVSRHPQQIGDLVAVAGSDSEIELRFTAPPGDGDWPPPADRYLIRQAASPILDDAGFDHARPLCGPADCGLVPTEVGQALTLRVTGLQAATTYHYAIRAGNAAGLIGPISNPASATTHPAAPASTPSPCPSSGAGDGGAARVVLAGGRYALVALPGGQAAGTGALWSWFDQGAEGAYVSNDPRTPLQAGHGYWAWSACSQVLEVPAGTRSVTFPLGAYHASMLGNPSGLAPAEARGHDFAARWDPAGNEGAGAYVMSAYRAPVTLAIGEGAWAFTFVGTEIHIEAAR